MDLLPGMIGTISAGVTVLLLTWLRGRRQTRHTPTTEKDCERLTQTYRKWAILEIILGLLGIPILAYGLWKGLVLLANDRLSQMEPSQFLVGPPSIVWVFPAVILAVLLAALPFQYFYRQLLGRKGWETYIEYVNQTYGFDTQKVGKVLALVFLPLCLTFTALTLDTYVQVTEKELRLNAFWGFGEQNYSWEDIQSVELVKSFQAPNGNIIRNPYYVIHFLDGTDYNFHQSLHDFSFDEQAQMVQFVLTHSRAPLVKTDPYPA